MITLENLPMLCATKIRVERSVYINQNEEYCRNICDGTEQMCIHTLVVGGKDGQETKPVLGAHLDANDSSPAHFNSQETKPLIQGTSGNTDGLNYDSCRLEDKTPDLHYIPISRTGQRFKHLRLYLGDKNV